MPDARLALADAPADPAHAAIEARLRDSEEQFRSFAEGLSDVAFVVDAAGAPLWWNRRHQELFGVGHERARPPTAAAGLRLPQVRAVGLAGLEPQRLRARPVDPVEHEPCHLQITTNASPCTVKGTASSGAPPHAPPRQAPSSTRNSAKWRVHLIIDPSALMKSSTRWFKGSDECGHRLT